MHRTGIRLGLAIKAALILTPWAPPEPSFIQRSCWRVSAEPMMRPLLLDLSSGLLARIDDGMRSRLVAAPFSATPSTAISCLDGGASSATLLTRLKVAICARVGSRSGCRIAFGLGGALSHLARTATRGVNRDRPAHFGTGASPLHPARRNPQNKSGVAIQ